MNAAETIIICIILVALGAGAVACFLRGLPRLFMEPSAASVEFGYAESFRRAAPQRTPPPRCRAAPCPNGQHRRHVRLRVTTQREQDLVDTPQQYRRKPIAIEAIQYQPGPAGNCAAIATFTGADLLEHADEACDPQTQWYIPTPAGELCINPGDWIIRDAQGTLSTTTPEAFAIAYEPPAEAGTDHPRSLLAMATDVRVYSPDKTAPPTPTTN